MATTRLLRSCRPLPHVPPPDSTSSSSFTTVKCIGKTTVLGGEKKKIVSGDGDNIIRKSTADSMANTDSFSIAEPRVGEGIIDMASLLASVGTALFKVLKRPAVKPKPWKLQAQMLIEKAIINCRFFTLFAVAGSLLGSILCFVEGCFITLESYFHYFSSISHNSDSDQGHMIHLLIEAIDMFLVGTAMFIFGVGLYTIFVRSKNLKEKGPGSNLFGLYHLKSLPTWVQVESISQAKSKIGHAVLMILQVGLLEKFKNIPLVTSLDLACFAGAVFVSSACIFLLSKLYVGGIAEDGR